MMKITETTAGRTFTVEMDEAELSGIGELLGIYANHNGNPVFNRMKGHALTWPLAVPLCHAIKSVIK